MHFDPDNLPGAFLISIDVPQSKLDILQNSSRPELIRMPHILLMAKTGDQKTNLIYQKNKKFYIETRTATLPVYVKFKGDGKYLLSNYPHLLFDDKEIVDIKAQVIIGRMTGPRGLLYNPFGSIELLEQSSLYIMNRDSIEFQSSLFERDHTASFEKIRDVWVQRYKHYAEEGRPIAIPLSGGYDSRLILSLATTFIPLDRICTYHEINSRAEARIAKSVAHSFNIPLMNMKKDDNFPERKNLSRDEGFILLAGMNNPNIIKMSMHIKNSMQRNQGENVRVIGYTGEEPHKCAYYNIIKCRDDFMKIYRVNRKHEDVLAKSLNLGNYIDFYTPAIDSWIKRAKQIYGDSISSHIDFVAHHAQLSNTMNRRNCYFFNAFGIDFPQHEFQLLNAIFSLPLGEKENFNIPHRMLKEFGAKAKGIPYISKHEQVLKQKESFIKKYAMRLFIFLGFATQKKFITQKGVLVTQILLIAILKMRLQKSF